MATGNIWLGREIGNYRIEEEIASGGFGIVFLAHHAILRDRPPVALKLMHTRLGTSEHHDQFIQEAQLLERLHHPHILQLIDVGITAEGSPYLITAYAPCGSLRDLLGKQQTPLPLTRALQIIQHIGQALHFAHSQNILHRDLKPANILFETPEHALLADFGIALMSEGNTMREMNAVGTPSYMAPEQFSGIVSKQSDQYALGCIAYELFTGRKLFSEQDLYQLMNRHVNQRPVPPSQINPDLPPHIEEAILTSLAKERSARYPDVVTFIDALQALPLLDITTSPYNNQNASNPGHQPLPENPSPLANSVGVGADEDTPVGRIISQQKSQGQIAYSSVEDARPSATPKNIQSPVSPNASTYPSIPSRISPAPGFAPPPSTSAPGKRQGVAAPMLVLAAVLVIVLIIGSVLTAHTAQINDANNATATAQTNDTNNAAATAQANNDNATATSQAIDDTNATATSQANDATATAVAAQAAQATANVVNANPDPYGAGGSLAGIDPLDGSNAGDWGTGNFCTFGGGTYHVTESGSGRVEYCRYLPQTFSNFVVEVNMTVLAGDAGGFVFRENDGVGYFLEIDSRGFYTLGRWDTQNGPLVTLRQSNNSSAAFHGGQNKIAVVAQGSQISWYINSRFVNSFNDGSFNSGSIALAASTYTNFGSTSAEVAYTDFRVWSLG